MLLLNNITLGNWVAWSSTEVLDTLDRHPPILINLLDIL